MSRSCSPTDMTQHQTKWNTREPQQQDQGLQPPGIEKKARLLRRRAELREAQNPRANHPLRSLPSTSTGKSEATPEPQRKPKRSREEEAPPGPLEKRPRADITNEQQPADLNVDSAPSPTGGKKSPSLNDGRQPLADTSPRLRSWLREGRYPAKDFFSDRTWDDIRADTVAIRPEVSKMDPRLARKKSATELRRQMWEAQGTDAPTEKTADKSQAYRSPGYVQELEDSKSYLEEAPEGISEESKMFCLKLLTTKQAIPQNTLFRDDIFMRTCQKVRDRNEARIVEDISPLIAPSPETLATLQSDSTDLRHLVFNANERWGNSVPVTKTPPQPDGSVGFRRSMYTIEQVDKLLPYIGNRVPYDFVSLFLATWMTFFPFFTREAKCGPGDLDVADRQNAHSMTIAVRGMVELFKLVNREQDLHRKIVAFSISHDARCVRIYGHYATIDANGVPSFWRHPIHSFDFTAQDGKMKWTAYQFTVNVYHEALTTLHPLISGAIDELVINEAAIAPRLTIFVPATSSTSKDTNTESASQDIAASVPGLPSSQGKKRGKTATTALVDRLNYRDGEMKALQQEMREERKENERQREEERKENERQREEERKEHERQRERLEKQLGDLSALLRGS